MVARKAVGVPCEVISPVGYAPQFMAVLHPGFFALAEERHEKDPVHWMQVYAWTVVDDHDKTHHLLGHLMLNREEATRLRAVLDRWLGGDADAP